MRFGRASKKEGGGGHCVELLFRPSLYPRPLSPHPKIPPAPPCRRSPSTRHTHKFSGIARRLPAHSRDTARPPSRPHRVHASGRASPGASRRCEALSRRATRPSLKYGPPHVYAPPLLYGARRGGQPGRPCEIDRRRKMILESVFPLRPLLSYAIFFCTPSRASALTHILSPPTPPLPPARPLSPAPRNPAPKNPSAAPSSMPAPLLAHVHLSRATPSPLTPFAPPFPQKSK